MKKWIIALVAAFGFAASPAFADSFGVRLGLPIGVQYQNFNPGEGTGFRIALGTYFFQNIEAQFDLILGRIPLGTLDNFTAFYGAGAHAGFWFGYFLGGYFNVGPQVTGGLEYLLQPGLSIGADLSLGLDLQFGNSLVSLIGFYYGGSFFVNFKL